VHKCIVLLHYCRPICSWYFQLWYGGSISC